MRQTSHYQLNQWEKDDLILMDDFNANNQKIEDALDGVKTLCNCQIYLRTYTGTGDAGPITHTFPHRPMFIMILAKGGGTWVFSSRETSILSGRISINTYIETPVTWGDKSITVGNADYTAFYCLNSLNSVYSIVALLDAAN